MGAGFNIHEAAGFRYGFVRGERDEGCIYYVGMEQGFAELAKALAGISCSVAMVAIEHWDDDLTPWPAPGLYAGDADFKGLAPETLRRLADQAIPAIEAAQGITPSHRAIAGYSLGGLFSLYAFANCPLFDAVASMSGSFWYPGWVEYLRGLKAPRTSGFAYLSLGDKECKAREPILHSVQKNTEATAALLQDWGIQAEWRLVPGNHFQHMQERVVLGLGEVAKQWCISSDGGASA